MEKQITELFDKLRQTLPTPQEKISEFTFYDSIGTQINDALGNLNILEVKLHDVIMRNVFKGIDYYSIVGLVPMWVRNNGHKILKNLCRQIIMNSLIGYCIIMIAKC